MDKVTLNIILTVIVFVLFIAIVFWAFGKRQKKGFDEAANLVFADEQSQQSDDKQEKKVND